MRHIPRAIRRLFCLIVSLGVLAGCGVAGLPGDSGRETVGQPTLPALTLPGDDWGYPSPFAFYARGPGYVRMSLLFDTLTWKDAEGLIPWLADDWTTSEDGTVWTFKLHPDVTWHDGNRLTAKDVAFTYTYFKAQRSLVTWSWPLDRIDTAEAVDEETVRITLTEPVAGAHDVLFGSLPILPQHIWEGIDDPLKALGEEVVIGSGPFTLAEYSKEEERYVYMAHPGYFKGGPRVSSLVFIKVENEALALKSGTTDYAAFSGKAIEAAKQFADDPEFEIIEGPGYWVLQLIFNTSRPPFDDVVLRRAVAHAIDRRRIVTQVTLDGAVVAELGVLSPETDWHHPDLPTYDHNPDEARRLLSQATEAAKLLPLTLIATAEYAREAELIQADLAEIGFPITVQVGDTGTLDGLLREGNFDVAINGHGGLANPAILESPTWPAMVYQNEVYRLIYEAQAQLSDDDARRPLVWQLQEMIASDLPVLTLWHPKMWTVYRSAKLDTWFYTPGGIGFGIPLAMNKLSFIN